MEDKTIAIPPGWTIQEQAEDRGISRKDLADQMSMAEGDIVRLIRGDIALSEDIAMRLETIFGICARYWLDLEALYRKKKRRYPTVSLDIGSGDS